jgi:hypothetical protein
VALSVASLFPAAGRLGRLAAMNPAIVTTAKWTGAFIGTVILTLVIYLASVFGVYVLAWVIEIFGRIFG